MKTNKRISLCYEDLDSDMKYYTIVNYDDVEFGIKNGIVYVYIQNNHTIVNKVEIYNENNNHCSLSAEDLLHIICNINTGDAGLLNIYKIIKDNPKHDLIEVSKMQETVKINCDIEHFRSKYYEVISIKDNLLFTLESNDYSNEVWVCVRKGDIVTHRTKLYDEKNDVCGLSAKEFLDVILGRLEDSNTIDIKLIVNDNPKTILVEISDYLKKLRDDHKLKIHLCPRQTGVTYDIIHNEHFIMVDNLKTKNRLKDNYPEEYKDSTILLGSHIDMGRSYDNSKLSLDNCYIFYDTNGDRVGKDVPKRLFSIFTPFSESKIYVTRNMYNTLRSFGRLEFWYTIEM